MMTKTLIVRKGVIRGFTERTLKGELLGFEAYSFAAQRVTGLVLLGFLVWHLYTLSSILSGPVAYDQAMKALERPVFKMGELLMLWVILFHALNGFRLILWNLIPGLSHRGLAYAVSITSLVLVLFSVPIIF